MAIHGISCMLSSVDRLDHRPNILQDTEVKRLLVIDRLAGQTAKNRALTENNWKSVDRHQIVRHSYND